MLLGLWRRGQADNAEKISASLGFKQLDMDPIIEQYSGGIGC
jgi:hypothetical protein